MTTETATAAPAAPAEQTTQTPTPAPAPAPQTSAPEAPQTDESDYLQLEEMSFEQRQAWERTGQMVPRAPKVDEAPADAGAVQDTPEEKGLEATPRWKKWVQAPRPAGVSKRQHLLNEMERRLAETEQARTAPQAQPAAPSQPAAQPAQQPWDGRVPNDPEPTIDQFADAEDPFSAHLRAHMRWEDRNDARVQHARTVQAQQQQEFATRAHTWIERRDAFAAVTPAFAEKALPFLERLMPNTPLGDAIMDSPVGPQIALHLAEHPAEIDRIAGLHWRNQLREIGKLEASLSTAPPAAPAQPEATTRKLVTDAPPMGTVLGTRAQEPVDPAKAAVAAGDYRAFEVAEDAKALATRRRG